MYKVYVAIDLDTDFWASWSDYTFKAKQVKNGVLELETTDLPIGTNGYSKPMYFSFNSEQDANQRDFYFDVYYKGKRVATDIRSREWDHEPSAWETPSYRLKEDHRKPAFKADPSRFKLKAAIHKIKKTQITTSNQTDKGTQVTQVVPSNINQLIQMIGDVISHGEGGYEGWNAGSKGTGTEINPKTGRRKNGRVKHGQLNGAPGHVTGKTIDQILATKSMDGNNPNRLFATGKYQTIIDTLQEAKNKLGLTGNELYSPELQERVFRDFLFEKAGGGKLADFVKRGKGTVDDAMYAASKEWASIAAPKGRKTKNGRISDGTQPYHDDGVNHANQESTAQLRKLLESIKLGASVSTNNNASKIEDSNHEIEPVQGVKVLFSGSIENARKTIVSQKTINILAAMAKEAGMSKIVITSTIRTPERQAELMLSPKARYGPRGRAVLAVRDKYASQGRAVQLNKMVEKIKDFWKTGQNVSNHVVSPESYNKLNVIDIGLNSNAFGSNNKATLQGQKFQVVFDNYISRGILSRSSISPYVDKLEGAFHLEIPQ